VILTAHDGVSARTSVMLILAAALAVTTKKHTAKKRKLESMMFHQRRDGEQNLAAKRWPGDEYLFPGERNFMKKQTRSDPCGIDSQGLHVWNRSSGGAAHD